MTHSHSHDHQHAPHSFNFAFALAIFLNAAFVAAQIFYALRAHSMGLLADAAHNAGDVIGLILAWIANWLLTLPAREQYSYGYRRTTMIAALANALILIASSMFIIWESINKLRHPVFVNSQMMSIVAFIGILINGSTALLFMRGAQSDLNIKSAFIHLTSDAAISVGVVIGGLLILWTHIFWIDPLIGLLIVGAILWSTFALLSDCVHLIMDAVPSHINQVDVQAYLEKLPGVSTVHDLHIWGLSTREVALTAHLVMPDKKLTDEAFHEINATLKKRFRIDHATLQVESGNLEFPCHTQEIC